jgi:6-phosphogluconolactonase
LAANEPPAVSVDPGAGPRHFAFHPNGKYAYVINEILLTVTAFRYDPETGTLTPQQTLSTLPAGVTDRKGMSTAEVQVHPSGKFLYGSNRGHHSIAIFTIDPTTGLLTPAGHQGAGIKTPRNFGIDPTGNYLLVANQDGGSVIVFRIHQTTGQLEPTDSRIEVSSPVCVKFLPLAG